jgi:hypothetical protein
MARRFEIDSEIIKQYSRFNVVGMQLTVRLQPPPDDQRNPVSSYGATMVRLFVGGGRGGMRRKRA